MIFGFQVANWERKEIQKASCCHDNEVRAYKAEAEVARMRTMLGEACDYDLTAELVRESLRADKAETELVFWVKRSNDASARADKADELCSSLVRQCNELLGDKHGR